MTGLQVLLSSSCLIVLTLLLRALFLHMMPKRFFVALWSLIAVRLLAPVSLPSRFSIFTWLQTQPAKPDIRHTIAGQTAAPLSFTHIEILRILWLVGVVACCTVLLAGYIASLSRFRCSVPVRLPVVDSWLSAHTLIRPLAVRSSDRTTVPLTYGLLRPVILLPKNMEKQDKETLCWILMHEWVHIRRCDAAIKLLLALCACVHWYNPLVWVMVVFAGRDIELACDAEVLRHADRKGKKQYALALIRFSSKTPGLAVLHNHFGKISRKLMIKWPTNRKASFNQRFPSKERVVSIVKSKPCSAKVRLASVVLFAAMALMFGTTACTNTKDNNAVGEANTSQTQPEAQKTELPDLKGKTRKEIDLITEKLGLFLADEHC